MKAYKRILAMAGVALALCIYSAAFAVPVSEAGESCAELPADGRGADGITDEEDDAAGLPLEGYVVGIDPGHQLMEDAGLEPVSPNDDTVEKARMSPGAFGVRSGTAEYSINLIVSLKLAALLRQAGAAVVLTRTSNDVSLSNIERAVMMNESDVDFWIRIHCNSSVSRKTRGAMALAPSKGMDIYADSAALAAGALKGLCAATGADSRGIVYTSCQTGFNWSKSPVISIEMGYLSNPREDTALCRDSYQDLCARGLCDGVIACCGESEGDGE